MKNKFVRFALAFFAIFTMTITGVMANTLEKAVKKVTEQRERDKGKGIYYDKLGRAHSLYDEDLVDIIRKQKEDLVKKDNE